jgi:uncharacterized SAM-binding protein YcdF (DUF218 family)
LRDTDALHALVVAGIALIASAGLLYLPYLWQVLRTARDAQVAPSLEDVDALLLFGKHSPAAEPDADFRARIECARRQSQRKPSMAILLLGGGTAPTEAAVAARALRAGPLPAQCELVLEDESRDTLENLRHAQRLLQRRGHGRVLLVSSRYHLARCARFANNLGIPHRLCAAEESRSLGRKAGVRVLGEAAYLMWIDLGMRWARLIGHRRMLAKVS